MSGQYSNDKYTLVNNHMPHTLSPIISEASEPLQRETGQKSATIMSREPSTQWESFNMSQSATIDGSIREEVANGEVSPTSQSPLPWPFQNGQSPLRRGDPHLRASVASQDDKSMSGMAQHHGRGPSSTYEAEEIAGRYQPSVVRQASFGRKMKPSIASVERSTSRRGERSTRANEIQSRPQREETVEALSKAISKGLGTPRPQHQRPRSLVTRGIPEVRMPFDSPNSPLDDAESPSLAEHPHDHHHHHHHRLSDLNDDDTVGTRLEPHRMSPLPERSPSSTSMVPLVGPNVGENQQFMSNKVPAYKRPAGIDLEAIREAEARGSLTSLPDLIRRATRLAANLDRGRTASRLALDVWGGSEVGSHRARESTYSDVLFSFPAPKAAASATHLRPTTPWPMDEKVFEPRKSRSRHKSRMPSRKCCGLSVTKCLILLILLVTLTAAAILLPVFLVVVPRQSQAMSSPRGCATTRPCNNGGKSIVVNDACACVCVGGFTGRDCAAAADSSCVTANLHDTDATYNNATIGTGILPTLSASASFNIPLNISSLLSLFSDTSLSCSGENSLVTFNHAGQIKHKKRLFMLHASQNNLHIPSSPHKDTHLQLKRQQAVTSTTNDIVFAATPAPTVTATTLQSRTALAVTTTSSGAVVSATPTTPAAISLTDAQLSFAQVVVLFVLDRSREANTAVTAQQLLQQYFRTGGPNNGTPSTAVVSSDAGKVIADFEKFVITLEDGSKVGDSAR